MDVRESSKHLVLEEYNMFAIISKQIKCIASVQAVEKKQPETLLPMKYNLFDKIRKKIVWNLGVDFFS